MVLVHGFLLHFPPSKKGLGKANRPQCPRLRDAWRGSHRGCLEAVQVGSWSLVKGALWKLKGLGSSSPSDCGFSSAVSS